jgi:hypothetical protein
MGGLSRLYAINLLYSAKNECFAWFGAAEKADRLSKRSTSSDVAAVLP